MRSSNRHKYRAWLGLLCFFLYSCYKRRLIGGGNISSLFSPFPFCLLFFSRWPKNKTNSAVQLIHKPTGIVVKSQATRSQSQNRTIAMNILAEKIELLEKGKDSRAAIVAETKKKRIASNIKKRKRKYKKLADEKAATTEREEKLSGEHGNDGERGESVETPNHASEMNQSDNEGDDNITSPM